MPEKTQKIIYWVATLLMTAIFLLSASMYILKHNMVQSLFEGYGYPTYLIYPLATAKILGLLAILCKKSDTLKEWAYAGFIFNCSLALTAHLMTKDGGGLLAILALTGTLVSYYFDKKLFPSTKK